MRRFLRPKIKTNCNNQFEILLALTSVGISLYVVYLQKKNIYYDMKSAESNEVIAQQLSMLNNSNFMYKLNCELDKEN